MMVKMVSDLHLGQFVQIGGEPSRSENTWTRRRSPLSSEPALRRDRHAGHPGGVAWDISAFGRCGTAPPPGSVLHNCMTALFANLSVELTSGQSQRQIRKAADKKEIIGTAPPTALQEIF